MPRKLDLFAEGSSGSICRSCSRQRDPSLTSHVERLEREQERLHRRRPDEADEIIEAAYQDAIDGGDISVEKIDAAWERVLHAQET